MSKKRKTIVPDFSSKRASGKKGAPEPVIAPHGAQPPAARVIPQSKPVKTSGHRGG